MAATSKHAFDDLREIEQGPESRKGLKRKASDGDLGHGSDPKKSRSEALTKVSELQEEVETRKDGKSLHRSTPKRVAIAGDEADFVKKYKQHKKLGEGAFGSVFAGVRISDQQRVAIKHIQRMEVDFVPVHFENKVYNVPKEVVLMNKAAPDQKSVGQDPTVSFLEWFILDEDQIVLVMERPTPSKDLFRHLLKNGSLPEEEAKAVMKQVVDALVDIHSKGIFHRDIKTDNILLQTTDSGLRIRIIDFGCGTVFQPQNYNGTITSAPPKNTDSWWAGFTTVKQIGGVLNDMLCFDEDIPFTTKNLMEGNIASLKDKSKECINFLQASLSMDPEERIRLDQLSHHPWFKQ